MTHNGDDVEPTPVWLQQSPIDVVDSLYAGGLKPLDFDYPALVCGEVEPRTKPGFSFVLNDSESASLCFDGQRCRLLKIHVHARSEHRIGGQDFPLEIHLVHEILNPRWGSKNVVVAVFVDTHSPSEGHGDEHPFAPMARLMGAKHLEELKQLHPKSFLPKSWDFYRYEGSLTTPKYDETVSWILLREPIRVLADDIRKLKEWAEHHARATQPSNRRFVLRSFV